MGCCCSVAELCPTLFDPMDGSMPGFLVLHCLPEWGLLSSCGALASPCGSFSCGGAQALGPQASVVVVHGLGCSEACEIFPDQESKSCLLHWQADSLLLSHQGSPSKIYDFYTLWLRW